MKKYMICMILFIGNALLINAQSNEEKEKVEQQKKQLQFPEFRSSEVIKAFNNQGYSGVHPRLFCTHKDVEKVKALLVSQDELMTKAWQQMRQQADEALTKPLNTGELDAAALRVAGVHANAVVLPSLLFSFLISEESKYAEKAWVIMEDMCTWQDWGIQPQYPYNDRHFLDTGIAAFNVAICWDILYDWMSDKQKSFLLQKAKEKLFTPTMAQYDGSAKRTWKWNIANNNWNGICNGGVVLASLSMFEENPQDFSKLIAFGVNSMPHYIREFEPQGQSEEGLMYWSYGLMYTLPALDAMNRILGTTNKMAETPGLAKAGYFPMYMTGPVVSLSVGDDPLKKNKAKSFFWLAKHNQDASLARLQYESTLANGGQMAWFDFFYYEPALVKKGKKLSLKKDNEVYGLELYSMRENWDNDHALFVAIHGGFNGANHGHLDAGTFDIQALGETWAYGNLGRDDYTFPGYFSKKTFPQYTEAKAMQKEPGRWHFYRLRTEGKNCMVFNTDPRPQQDENGIAIVTQKVSGKNRSSFTFDLSNCYARDVVAYDRKVTLDRKKREIEILDSFEAVASDTAWWSMHTKAEIKISEDGKSASLIQNGKKVYLRLHSTDKDARFREMPATYLKPEWFPYSVNSENTGMRKLCVCMCPERKKEEIRVTLNFEQSTSGL